MLRFGLLAVSLGLTGCFVVFGNDNDPPDVCALAEDANEPAIAQAPLRNPDNLSCESFGDGCNPECGPCPALTGQSREPANLLAPTPSWNYCGHRCETLSESACSTDPECRVVKDARCNVSLDCETDFMGCFPTDTQPATGTDCFRIFDGWECSRDSACTAMHYGVGGATRESQQQLRPFAMCVPEGKSPGQCWSEATCDRLPPNCPSGTTPGLENGCYTGGCIPLDICEARQSP